MAKPSVSNAGPLTTTGHSPLQSTIPQVKLENASESPPQRQSQSPNPHVKSEQVEVNGLPIVALPPEQPDEQSRSRVLESVDGLCNLSTAIREFKSRFDELEKHLDSIRTAIESREQPRGEVDGGEAVAADGAGAVPACSAELLSLCETMCGKSLRKYIITHLDNVQKLREEVPSALKKAPRPARLVLDCIGRFYLQGSKAYAKNSPMVPGREACVLALEFFLLMVEEVQLEEHVRQEAVQAAMNWRKRLVLEGGIRKASEIDAKGLLLFVAGYGIPKLFRNEDIWDLVLAGNAGQVAEALRKSTVLVSRVTEIIEQMMTGALKQNAKLEAVDVASSFGIDDKFPPQKLLTAYLRESKEALKKRRREANSLPMLLKQANDRHLSALQAVTKFLEDRKLDPLKVVPGWQLAEKITKLEKDNVDLNKKLTDKAMIKRRADLNDKTASQAMKRPRAIGQASTGSPSIGSLHEHNSAAGYMSPYNTNPSLRVNYSHPLGAYGGDAYPSATSAPPYSSAGAPENHAVMHAGGVNHLHQGVYNVPSTSASAANVASGLRREAVVDRAGHMVANNNSLPYGLQAGQSYVSRHPPTYGMFGPSPSTEGFPGLPNSPPPAIGAATNPADLYRFADSVVESEYNSRGGW